MTDQFKVWIEGQEVRPANLDALEMSAGWSEPSRFRLVVVAQRDLVLNPLDTVTISILVPLPRWRRFLYRLFRRRLPVVMLGRYRITSITREWWGDTIITGEDVLSYEMEHTIL